jgi:hypothetical protein
MHLPQTGGEVDARGRAVRQTPKASGSDHPSGPFPSGASQSLSARFYRNGAEQKVGHGYYVCSDTIRLAVPGADPGLVVTRRGGMVYVGLL